MSRDKNYQRLLNDKKWKELRAWYLRQHPLCEMCEEKGLVVSAIDLHHKIPVETAKTPDEMRDLCYRPDNLQALCISCHAAVHRQMRSHSREAHRKREDERLERWKARHNPGGPF